jgi:hypothetical protein
MHMLIKFGVFKFPNIEPLRCSSFPCPLLSFLFHQGSVKVVPKVLLYYELCLFEHLRFNLRSLNVHGV